VALKVSFEVASCIVKAKKPHSITEEFILLSAVDTAEKVLQGHMMSKMLAIFNLNDTTS
jgi:hypothetical protein